MDWITETSPKRLIVADFFDSTAKGLFGTKYEYRMVVSDHDANEDLRKIGKPVWMTVLGDESSELYDEAGTLQNEVLINGWIVASVQSNKLVHAQEYFQDIEQMKMTIVGMDACHKNHWIYGNFHTKEFPAYSVSHDVDYVYGTVLRVNFAIVMRIFSERV